MNSQHEARARKVWDARYWDAIGCGESVGEAERLANEAAKKSTATMPERDWRVVDDQHRITFTPMIEAVRKIRSKANREQCDNLIDSARTNANDTLIENKGMADDEWDSVFRGTLVSLLSDGVTDRHVIAFFAKFGVRS